MIVVIVYNYNSKIKNLSKSLFFVRAICKLCMICASYVQIESNENYY